MTPTPLKPTSRLADRAAAVQALNGNLASCQMFLGPDGVFSPLRPETPTARGARELEAKFATALAALDGLVRGLRPQLEVARTTAAELGAELAAEELAAAEAEVAEQRRQEFEDQVAAEVRAEERRRMAAVDAGVRARLAPAGGGF